jgi:hypothetical protein
MPCSFATHEGIWVAFRAIYATVSLSFEPPPPLVAGWDDDGDDDRR